MAFIVNITENALMDMTLAAVEGYSVRPVSTPKKIELETLAYVWGHINSLPGDDILISVDRITIDSMAHRKTDSIRQSDSLTVFNDIITSYWPQYSYLGDYHTHPYGHFSEVERIGGYQFSETDMESMKNNIKTDYVGVSLVMTIAALKRASSSPPNMLSNNIITWTFGNYRFWLNACVTTRDNESFNILNPPDQFYDAEGVQVTEDFDNVFLTCPYLTGVSPFTPFGRKIIGDTHYSAV